MKFAFGFLPILAILLGFCDSGYANPIPQLPDNRFPDTSASSADVRDAPNSPEPPCANANVLFNQNQTQDFSFAGIQSVAIVLSHK